MKATFGMTIRAARMGYHAVEGVGFVRVLASDSPPCEVHILPFDGVKVQKDKTEHRVWWADEECRRMVSEVIKRHVTSEVTKTRVLFLDDYGNDVGATKL